MIKKDKKYLTKPIINHQVIEIFLNNNIKYTNNKIINKNKLFCTLIGLNVLKTISYNFKNYGNSTIFILSESHLAVHYWPEKFFLHMDLVTCKKGGINLILLNNIVKDVYGIRKVKILNLKY
jgi:S-adenosylmethionine/arginine decarboxylase-like enzyme